MLQGEHSEILSTVIKLPFVIKIFVLSIFEWPLKAGLTVNENIEFQGLDASPIKETKSATMNIFSKKKFFLNHL